VKQFGTEGRNEEVGGIEIVPPSEEKNHYPYVEFAITMIKQLKVVEPEKPEEFKDPAISIPETPPELPKKKEVREPRKQKDSGEKPTRN